MDKDK